MRDLDRRRFLEAAAVMVAALSLGCAVGLAPKRTLAPRTTRIPSRMDLRRELGGRFKWVDNPARRYVRRRRRRRRRGCRGREDR